MIPFWQPLKHWPLSEFMPHGHCYLWQPDLIALQVATNGLIALSYLAISLTLVRLVQRIRDLPFDWMYLAFGVFIVACGATHLMDIVVIWAPAYWLDAGIRVITAVASAGTALLLIPQVRKAVSVAKMMEERQRTRKALSESEELLTQAQQGLQARNVFLSIAAHELKTPLTPLRLEVDGLLRGLRAGRERPAALIVDRLAVVQSQITRLDRLVSNLLDVSHLAAGQFDLNLEELDLAQVVRDVVERHKPELLRNGYALPLVPSEGPTQGRWDRARVEQIVTNLLTNAIKYGQGKPLTLKVSGSSAAVELTVQDQGIGIAAEDQERIFERFERAVSARHYGGLGLGLWLVSQSAKVMGGTIRVQSEPQAGSTFVLELPALRG